jgi:hypothetical protein
MKLRLRGNSVRIRLTQSEVKTLDATGLCEEAVVFSPAVAQRLVYRVETASVSRPSVSMSTCGVETVVKATLPQAEVAKWARGSDVGIYFEEPWELKVAIEKDFRCLDEKRDEDESDNFENPNTAASLHSACHAD